MRYFLVQGCQLVEVGRKETKSMDLRRNVPLIV